MTISEQIKQHLLDGMIEPDFLQDIITQVEELQKKSDRLEELLITVVRTGWPWDENNDPNALFHNSKDGYSQAMSQARALLGLDYRSTITRTEPRT